MSKATKRTLAAAVVIAVACAPSAASAKVGTPGQRGVEVQRTQASTVPATGASYCHRRAGRCISAASVQKGTATVGTCHRQAGRCVSAPRVQVGTATVGVCHRQAGRCIAPTNVQVATTSVGVCHRRAGRCGLPASGQAKATAAHRSFASAHASPEGLQWGDAGIGAAGMLFLLIAGGVALTAGRREHHGATTS